MIPVCEPVLLGNEKKYVMDCLDTLWISSQGKYVRQFEESFARYCNVTHGVACANGTVGLHMALETMGVGAGDEVIIPDFTIIVTANVVIMAGGQPGLGDVEAGTWGLDPAEILGANKPRAKADMGGDMYGRPRRLGP